MTVPVIIIGMHRSGTSLFSELIEQLGLFVGHKKDNNNEAIFFMEINRWLLNQCGARWDNPESIKYLWRHPESLEISEKFVTRLMRSPRAIRFMGLTGYLKYGSIPNLKGPWGWKDPRSTFTLPFWLRLFPEAKVIHIKRHGVDVAKSLRQREIKSIEYRNKKYVNGKAIIWQKEINAEWFLSRRMSTLEGSLALWSEYTDRAEAYSSTLGAERMMSFHYEELLENPVETLRTTSEFCGLDFDPDKARQISSQINASRKFSYEKNPELKEFARENAEKLARHGY